MKPDATLLDLIRAAGIPHASVCGRRGRCSTCRVRIGKELEGLPPTSEQEIKFYRGSLKLHRFVSPASSIPQMMSKLLPWLNQMLGQTKPHAGLDNAEATK